MGKIIYEITSGTLPVTVDLSPLGLQNVHVAFGTYEFDGIDVGNYTITFTDSTPNVVCEEVELVTPCLTCPEGYAYVGDGCEKIEAAGAEEYLPLETIVSREAREYSSKGTLIFDDWSLDGTGTFEQINTSNEYWKNDWVSTVKGPMNRSGVWVGQYRSKQQIRFSSCIDIALSKTYYIGMGCDNYSSIYLNGKLIIEQDLGAIAAMLGITSHPDRPPFNYWYIYPIEIPAGRNILEAVGNNEYSIAGLGVEIYDATKNDLINATSDIDLGDKLLFRAKDEVGNDGAYEYSEGSGFHGYVCPPGYALVTCRGNPYCQKKLVIECDQLFAEVDTSTITFDPDCSIITFPHLSNTGMNKTYIMNTYFEPDRLLTEFESIEIVRTIPSPNAEIKYNGVLVTDGQTIDFSEQNAIEIYTKNYLEEDTVSDVYFKIHLIGEELPTQELHYRFINEACDVESIPVAMYVSVDIVLSGDYNFAVEENITYNPGNEVSFTNPIITGYHYMFISIPSGRTFTIKDPLNVDITNKFSYRDADNRVGFANNSIYRYEEPFGTNAPVTFTITLI